MILTRFSLAAAVVVIAEQTVVITAAAYEDYDYNDNPDPFVHTSAAVSVTEKHILSLLFRRIIYNMTMTANV